MMSRVSSLSSTRLGGLAVAALLLGAAAGCGSDDDEGGLPSTLPRLADATFSNPTVIDHPWHPLLPGFARVSFEQTPAGPATTVAQALDETREVARVKSRVLLEQVYVDGQLTESTRGSFAQDDEGNVWLMGEAIERYAYDALGAVADTDRDGSWEAGQDLAGVGVDAHAGHGMPADPKPGQRFHRQYYADVVEDLVEVIAVGPQVTLTDGSTFSALQTFRHTRLEPDLRLESFYAQGIGEIREVPLGTAAPRDLVGAFRPGAVSVPAFATARFDASTTIDHPYVPLVPGASWRLQAQTAGGRAVTEVEVLAETRVVSGVECVVVRRTVTVGGRLQSDTHTWFAQDNRGNVWAMGAAVDAYAYDEQGNALPVTHEGSWESGLDVAGVGSIAAPGHLLPVELVDRVAFHRVWYPGVADDMAYVVSTRATATLPDGTTYGNCVQTLVWAPRDPAKLAYEYYAPDVGLVLVVPLGAEAEAAARE
jgi:hypothetical protein